MFLKYIFVKYLSIINQIALFLRLRKNKYFCKIIKKFLFKNLKFK